MSKAKKDLLKMTGEELARQTRMFDGGAIPPGRPLGARDRARWEKSRLGGSVSVHLGPGRPKVGEGAVAVPVSVEAGLLRRAIAKAQSLRLKRSEYFAKALQLLTDGQVQIGGAKLTVASGTTPAGGGKG